MKRHDFTDYRRVLLGAWHLLWPVMRQVLGWIFILLGLLGLVLPVLQGLLFLVIGLALVGRRNWLIRRARVLIKRSLRRWAALRTPLIGPAGRMALRAQWKFSREARHLQRRCAEWARRRFRGRAIAPTDESQESRYERASERV
jgi:hypothetical protein